MYCTSTVCVPAGTLDSRYRPTLLARTPALIAGIETWAPAMGCPLVTLRTAPVIVPVCAATGAWTVATRAAATRS